MTDASRTFWDREIQRPTHVEWMAIPAVAETIHRRVGGGTALWPLDWFERAYPGTKFERALSIGCGAGALERDLVRRGLCATVDAFDGSIASLAAARREARAAGMGGQLRYFAADFNAPAFPRAAYDAVFIHQALHHVAKLEKLLRAIRRCLKPGGLLYLEEYVGPSSTAWNADRLAPLARLYEELPRSLRRLDRLPSPIQADDPSEAIRSGEIREQVAIGYDVEHERGYGGNLLSVILPALALEQVDDAWLADLIAREEALLDSGEPDFYAVFVARPKRGPAGLLADLRYFVEPKLKRIGRELSARLSP
jgi:O-antigen biosynthesis protein